MAIKPDEVRLPDKCFFMQPTSTPEQLVRLLYHETTPEETRELEACLDTNETLRNEFRQMSEAKAALDNDGHGRPGVSTLERIRAYAAEKNLQEAL